MNDNIGVVAQPWTLNSKDSILITLLITTTSDLQPAMTVQNQISPYTSTSNTQ